MIHPLGTPALHEAASKTLEWKLQGGGGHTGWSRAWASSLYARLGEGDKAHESLYILMNEHMAKNLLTTHPKLQSYQPPGLQGSCDTCFRKGGAKKRRRKSRKGRGVLKEWGMISENGDTFQIDGNLGGLSAMQEMLLWSHTKDLELLPAIPDRWWQGGGEVEGLSTRHGVDVAMVWGGGVVKSISLSVTSRQVVRGLWVFVGSRKKSEDPRRIELKQSNFVVVTNDLIDRNIAGAPVMERRIELNGGGFQIIALHKGEMILYQQQSSRTD